MSEQYYNDKYANSYKRDHFEFITETLAYFAVDFGIKQAVPRRELIKDGTILDVMNFDGVNSIRSATVPVVYYAIKEYAVSYGIEKAVNFLAMSPLGRYIIRKLVLIDNSKAIPIAINVAILMAIYHTIGVEINPAQVIEILVMELGTNYADEKLNIN